MMKLISISVTEYIDIKYRIYRREREMSTGKI